MRKLYLLANIALIAPIVIYLLSLVLQQFTNTMWWYRTLWDPISDFFLQYAFFGLPLIALAFVFSTPAMGILSKIVKVLIVLGFIAFISLHLLFLVQLGTIFPSDLGASIFAFLLLMIVGPIFFFGSLILSIKGLPDTRSAN